MSEHVGDSLVQPRVGFDLLLLDLILQPIMKFLHHRLAVAAQRRDVYAGVFKEKS